MNQTDLILEARGVSIWRGEHLLVDDQDILVPPGSIVQIQGSNGSGKTTLLRALIGLSEYDEGELRWQGQAIHKVREEMHGSLLYLGHKPGITGGLTPYENLLALCPELNTDDPVDASLSARDRVISVLEDLDIADRIDLPSDALSAGQKRRVSLARLKLQYAKLWVLDEPLTSLDAKGQAWVQTQIQEQVINGGSVLFTTHQALSFEGTDVTTIMLGESGR